MPWRGPHGKPEEESARRVPGGTIASGGATGAYPTESAVPTTRGGPLLRQREWRRGTVERSER